MNGQSGYGVIPEGLPSCKRCRGTGRMATMDGHGDVDVDVCDCILEQMREDGERKTRSGRPAAVLVLA